MATGGVRVSFHAGLDSAGVGGGRGRSGAVEYDLELWIGGMGEDRWTRGESCFGASGSTRD